MISRIEAGDIDGTADFLFQSRNRGSFDFKTVSFVATAVDRIPFQSRNRGSFDFKCVTPICHFRNPPVSIS